MAVGHARPGGHLGRSPPQRARGLQRRERPPDDVLAHAARGEHDRVGDAAARRTTRAARRRACAGRAARRRPGLGVELVAQPAQGRAQQQRRRASSAWRTSRRRGPRSSSDRRRALHDLQRDVAGEAVGDDHVGLAGARSRSPRRCRRSSAARGSASTSWAATTVRGPLRRPPRRWRAAPTRGRATPSAGSMNAAPMWANWTRCSGRTSTLAPASSSRNGAPGTGTSTASAGRWMPRAALDAEQRRRPAPCRSSRRRPARRRARRRRRDGRARSRRPGSRARRAPVLGLGDRDRRVDDLDAVGHVADLGRRAEQQHAHAALRRQRRQPARDLGGAEVGPVRIDRDGDRVGHARR